MCSGKAIRISPALGSDDKLLFKYLETNILIWNVP